MLITLLAAFAIAKPQPLPAEDNVRAVWNLTFTEGDPPSISEGGKGGIDFDEFGLAPDDIATKLSAAFNKGATDEKPIFSCKAVGNSLVMFGPNALVQEARRLLATQIDVPQSQILLELDTYQVSANLKAREAAERSVRRLVLAQEIARVYKVAHLQAVKSTVMKLKTWIASEIQKRTDDYGLDVAKLFNDVGLDPNSARLLGQSDLLVLLAYCPDQDLRETFLKELRVQFEKASHGVNVSLLEPLRDSADPQDRQFYPDLRDLNAKFVGGWERMRLRACADYPTSGMLRAIAGGRTAEENEAENEITRHAIEEFLMLWLSTADSDVVKKLDAAFKRGPSTVYSDLQAMYGQGLRAASKERQKQIVNSLSGDRAAKFVRSSARLDDLIQVGMEGLQEDSRTLVDNPLRAWIDSQVISRSQNSTFGVRFGGTTKLAVTSRSPGIIGSETDTFFSSQPPSPIDLNSLIPILSRKTGAAAGEAGPPAGITPQENLLLQGIFNQASKPPFFRKLGTGLHMSVLPTVLGNGSTARVKVKLNLTVTPDDSNKEGAGSDDKPGPLDLIKTSVVETELLVNAFDIATLSSLKIDVTAPGKRDWAVPVLSQILPIRSWFVGPTQDKTIRHEAVILIKVTIIPRAMDVASRFLNPQN
ncbi:MAG: hypothetical protein H7Y17_10745 [Chlorobia bacterium]|nr:hypothetical protein [Fimbriimonadaceae bacterium]